MLSGQETTAKMSETTLNHSFTSCGGGTFHNKYQISNEVQDNICFSRCYGAVIFLKVFCLDIYRDLMHNILQSCYKPEDKLDSPIVSLIPNLFLEHIELLSHTSHTMIFLHVRITAAGLINVSDNFCSITSNIKSFWTADVKSSLMHMDGHRVH